VPLFAKPLDGSREIIIQGEGGSHYLMMTHRDA
jgi:hypothetical protein